MWEDKEMNAKMPTSILGFDVVFAQLLEIQ